MCLVLSQERMNLVFVSIFPQCCVYVLFSIPQCCVYVLCSFPQCFGHLLCSFTQCCVNCFALFRSTGHLPKEKKNRKKPFFALSRNYWPTSWFFEIFHFSSKKQGMLLFTFLHNSMPICKTCTSLLFKHVLLVLFPCPDWQYNILLIRFFCTLLEVWSCATQLVPRTVSA